MRAIRSMKYLRMATTETDTHAFEGYEALDVKVGGMGMVIEARDPELDRKVAIKLWMHASDEAETALLEEAQTLAKLNHPNVVTVYGTGQWRERVYFVMEWVEGRDGHEWMKTAPSWQEIREVFIGAGEGLAAAHDAGIQHRDFKPANMLVGQDGRVRVADFGVADSLGAVDPGQAPGGPLAGTPAYMAPERLRGERGDARSDQFSFCGAVWRGLHGLRPYAGQTPEELLDSIECEGIQAGLFNAEVPHWLSRIARKGLEPDPEQRHADMHELVRLLREGPPPDDEPDGPGDEQVEADEQERGLIHAPVGRGSGDASRRWRFFVYGAMTSSGVVMVGVVVLALLRSPKEGPGFGQDDLTADSSLPELQRPAEDLPRDGVTREEIISMIESEDFEKADRTWEREETRRRDLRVPTYHDSLAIGRAFLQQAVRLREKKHPEQASEAAAFADKWARFAVADLELHGQPPNEANALAQAARAFEHGGSDLSSRSSR